MHDGNNSIGTGTSNSNSNSNTGGVTANPLNNNTDTNYTITHHTTAVKKKASSSGATVSDSTV